MGMNKTLSVATILILATIVGCTACDQQGPAYEGGAQGAPPPKTPPPAETGLPPARPPLGPAKVVETMNAAGYTYVHVEAAGQKSWWAAPPFDVAVGDTVMLPQGAMPMRNFPSKALNRTFDLIYFAGRITKAGADEDPAKAVEDAHAAAEAAAPDSRVSVKDIEKAEGDLTVEGLYKGTKELVGKEVLIRGKVVKYNANIMGKNWIHVRDGTGGDDTNDITVTTSDTAKVGDKVLVRGKLVADKDFGFGYKFAIMIEDAKLTVE